MRYREGMTAPPPRLRPFRRTAALLLSAALAAGPCFAAPHAAAKTASAAQTKELRDDAEFRAERARNLSAPDGWLTLVGLEWLKAGPNTVGLAADNSVRLKGHAPEHLGVIEVEGGQLQLKAPAGGFPKFLYVNGKPAQEGPLTSDDGRASVLSTENLTMVVLHRGDRFALRIKDSQAPTRINFKGLHWYPLEAKYRITAKWIPFNPPHTAKIPTIIGTTLDMPAPGLAEFTLDGKTIQLEPVLEDPNARELFFILRDATSRTTTYESARFLYTEFPDHGLDKPGTVVLDFNRLQNPPCAYTPYATCPLPPFENRLAVAIPAGEERYSH
jgi:uncharacterized protein (DUF1684 family)